jgi:hypothetical protein
LRLLLRFLEVNNYYYKNSMSGFITLSRRIFGHLFFTEKREFSRFEAWLDLIRRANWQDGFMLIGNTSYVIKRGQVLASERQMAEWWGWSQKRVQTFLKLGVSEAMISIEKESVGSRITLCKYDSYNTSGISLESEKNQDGISLESGRHQLGIAQGIKSNNIKKNKEEKKEKQTPQAGGEIFEKLSNRVGPVTAKICIEGNVGQLVGDEKRPQLLRWLEHKFTKGQPIITTQVLFAIVQQFQANDLETLTSSITESIGGDYARLVITKPKATDKKPVFPNYWQPGIEAKNGYTPEQTLDYHRRLISLGWYKTTVHGQPYWNRPAADNAARTGEGTISKTLQQT